MVAYPASYGVSGIMTFLVNHDGVVYEVDLGPETEAKAKAMKVFDLDAKTVRVPDQDETLTDADVAAEE